MRALAALVLAPLLVACSLPGKNEYAEALREHARRAPVPPPAGGCGPDFERCRPAGGPDVPPELVGDFRCHFAPEERLRAPKTLRIGADGRFEQVFAWADTRCVESGYVWRDQQKLRFGVVRSECKRPAQHAYGATLLRVGAEGFALDRGSGAREARVEEICARR